MGFGFLKLWVITRSEPSFVTLAADFSLTFLTPSEPALFGDHLKFLNSRDRMALLTTLLAALIGTFFPFNTVVTAF